MEFAAIMSSVFSFLLIKIILDQRAKTRSQNVKLLEEALKSPQVDRPTLETLTYQLTGKRGVRQEGTSGFMAVVLAIGWIALFTGIALVVVSSLIHSEDLLVAGSIVGIVGFAFVTYPFALRELEARRQA